MQIPFGSTVVTSDGKVAGKVKRLFLHPHSQAIDGVVVHEGVWHWEEFVVPLSEITVSGGQVRLARRADQIDEYPAYHPEHFVPLSTQGWGMPAGFDDRDFFLVGGSSWAEATLPFQPVTPSASGVPRYVPGDEDTPQDPREPSIRPGMHVYDRDGHAVGEIESVTVDDASQQLSGLTIKHGVLFARHEVTVPATMIAKVTQRGVTLHANADQVQALEGKE